MTLQRKTLFITTATLVLLTAALYVVASSTLRAGFARLEEQSAQRDMQRALGALNGVQRDVGATAGDYSHWDDTYNFIVDGNPSYIESNLVDSTFSGLRINLMVFIDDAHRVVYAKAYDVNADKQIDPPNDLAALLYDGSPLLQSGPDGTLDGILTLGGKPMLVSARSILRSDRQGPSRGTLIMGRYLEQSNLDALGSVTQLTISLLPATEWPGPLPALKPVRTLDQGHPDALIKVYPLDNRTFGGFTLLPDIFGQPAFVLRADIVRDVGQQSAAVDRTLLVSLLVVGLLFVFFNHTLLRTLVLARVASLAAEVSRISWRGDASARVAVTSKDEVAQLSESINGMLETLEHSQQALRESEKQYRELAGAEHEQRELAETLRDISKLLNGTLQIEEVMERILDTLDRVVPHDAANIMLFENGNARVFRSKGYNGRTADFILRSHVFPINATANLRTVMETGQPLAIPDVNAYPGWAPVPRWTWVKSWAGAPIRTYGQITGFLNVESETPGFYDETHAGRLQAVAEQAGIAVKNAQLYGEVLRYALELEMQMQERAAADEAPSLVPTLRQRLQQISQQSIRSAAAPLTEQEAGMLAELTISCEEDAHQ